MDYIFFFLELILAAIGGVSLYTYVEITEEHDHSENAKQISLVNIILPFGVLLITLFFYYFKTLSLDRLVMLTLFACIIAGFISFAVYYLLWKEDDDYNYDGNKELKEVNEVTYLFSIFLLIFIIGVLIGSGSMSSEPAKQSVGKPVNLVKLNTGKTTPPTQTTMMTPPSVKSSDDDLMDNFIGKDPNIQKVLIL